MIKPVPVPDRDSAPYWEALSQGELRIQRCCQCQTLRWPARPICNACYSFEAEWVPMSGRGTIRSWIRTHQRFMPGFDEHGPPVTLLVALDEQPDIQLIGAFADPADIPATGAAVHAVFKDPAEEPAILFWKCGPAA